MECLHGELASCSQTPNGTFFYCGQKPSCNFFCPQNDCSYFQNAINLWKNSNCPQPECHIHNRLAKMRVVKDILKPNFGRPFFICSAKENPCSFWQWADVLKPNCYHGLQCFVRKVKKDGPNHGRLFYTCSQGKDDSCGFFEWLVEKKDEDPFESFCIEYFNNPPSFDYILKETGKISKSSSRSQTSLRCVFDI